MLDCNMLEGTRRVPQTRQQQISKASFPAHRQALSANAVLLVISAGWAVNTCRCVEKAAVLQGTARTQCMCKAHLRGLGKLGPSKIWSKANSSRFVACVCLAGSRPAPIMFKDAVSGNTGDVGGDAATFLQSKQPGLSMQHSSFGSTCISLSVWRELLLSLCSMCRQLMQSSQQANKQLRRSNLDLQSLRMHAVAELFSTDLAAMVFQGAAATRASLVTRASCLTCPLLSPISLSTGNSACTASICVSTSTYLSCICTATYLSA